MFKGIAPSHTPDDGACRGGPKEKTELAAGSGCRRPAVANLPNLSKRLRSAGRRLISLTKERETVRLQKKKNQV